MMEGREYENEAENKGGTKKGMGKERKEKIMSYILLTRHDMPFSLLVCRRGYIYFMYLGDFLAIHTTA